MLDNGTVLYLIGQFNIEDYTQTLGLDIGISGIDNAEKTISSYIYKLNYTYAMGFRFQDFSDNIVEANENIINSTNNLITSKSIDNQSFNITEDAILNVTDDLLLHRYGTYDIIEANKSSAQAVSVLNSSSSYWQTPHTADFDLKLRKPDESVDDAKKHGIIKMTTYTDLKSSSYSNCIYTDIRVNKHVTMVSPDSNYRINKLQVQNGGTNGTLNDYIHLEDTATESVTTTVTQTFSRTADGKPTTSFTAGYSVNVTRGLQFSNSLPDKKTYQYIVTPKLNGFGESVRIEAGTLSTVTNDKRVSHDVAIRTNLISSGTKFQGPSYGFLENKNEYVTTGNHFFILYVG